MSKVTVKKNLIVFHRPEEWEEIYHRIFVDFGIKMSVSYVLKRELGFTVRHHRGLAPILDKEESRPLIYSKVSGNTHYYEDQVHLDFYSDSALTWFQLRYL
jgi:hypothetical protein